MARPLERFLNLKPGDSTRGLLLFTYLFLVMASYMAARIARDAIFLGNFLAVDLAYVDLASAALIGVVIAGYLAIGRHVRLPNLLVGSLLFYTINLVVLWYVAIVHDPAWLSPVIYIWVSIFGAIAPVQVWTLANYVLTTREAKRVFGLVGSGAILGAVVGAKLSSIMAKRFGAESLLVVVAVAMVACVALVPLIWQRRETMFGTAHPPADGATRVRVRDGLRQIGKVPYLRAIAALILVANITTSLAGWQFKALAKFFIPQKDALAAFFGDFYFYAGILGFLVQLAVTGRLLRRFGLGPALLLVPIAFVFGSSGVLLWGSVTIWAAIVLRSCINVLQYSVDKPSVELLYLPVPAAIKNQVKSFIDTVVWRFGDGLAAVAVLLFGKGLGWIPQQVSWVVLVLVAGWMIAAVIARRLYVDTLRASILEHRLDAERESADVLDRSLEKLLTERLSSSDPKEVLYALELFDVERQHATHPAIRHLLDHPAAAVRGKALALLNEADDKSAIPRAEALLKDDDLGVRTEAMAYLARHADFDPLARVEELGRFGGASIRSAVVAYLARPGRAQNLDVARLMLVSMCAEAGPGGKLVRLEAARLLAYVPSNTDDLHGQLLGDEDAEVAREAIRTLADGRQTRMFHRLVQLLQHPELAPDAAEVIAKCGTPDAARILNEAVLEGDPERRLRIISALNKLYRARPDLERDETMIETVLTAEIMGHYRSYQILGARGERPGASDPNDPATTQLRDEMQQEMERIFRLLALLHPDVDLHSAYYGIQSHDHVVHDNALEFLDNVLDKRIRRLLVPLVDSTVTVAERSRMASDVVGL